ncbi:hypothetical protein P3T76_009306 [Phytophthora citrophthora]|uniref:Transmembrane protein n=1 Tax=Phytophthora citrophthora TaxID=4793 RepID=A0AAD9GGN9_9STRA|nr:hypothetical protein P3T76_009306 [Phytophthora citrophthora]
MKPLPTSLPSLARLAALLCLYSLDVLDLYAKVAWIGPFESFSFEVVHEHSFDYEPLPRPVFLDESELIPSTALGTELVRVSGWTSLYDKCSDLYATKDEHFDMVKAVNCQLGAPFTAEQYIANELVLSATIGVDSIAWASCQLLFFHRRPPLCQENIVTRFYQRYQLTESEVDFEKMAPINSMAEAEILRMLKLLSRSHPLSSVVCAQGFESTAGPGHYNADMIVCGSPNIFESAFVGMFAKSFTELLDELAHLEVYKVNIMGFELVSRQNSRSDFILREHNGEIIAIEENATNFSTFGHLGVILILVDVALFIAHVRASLDTCRMFGWKELVGFHEATKEVADDESDIKLYGGNSNWLLLYRSLYHSTIITGLTVLSALISWLVNFPFALMWYADSKGNAFAFVSALRIWTLVLCLLNIIWSLIVRISESRAYNVVKSTFVNPLEVVAVSAFFIIVQTGRIFEVAGARRQLESQQGIDNESFPGRLALSNAYNQEVDGFATTPPHIIHVLFGPLVAVVMESLGLVVLVLIAKAMYYRQHLPEDEDDSANSVSVVDFDDIDGHLTGQAAAPLIRRRPSKPYRRLPLEELLRTPARANCLVRCCFDIDKVEDDGLTYILPHVYYDFGVVVSDAGLLRTRNGFSTVIQRRIDVDKFFAPAEQPPGLPSPLKKIQGSFRHSLSKAKLVLRSMQTPVIQPKSIQSPVVSPRGIQPPMAVQNSPLTHRTLAELRQSPMSRSMRRRKSMEDLLENSVSTF